MDFIDEMTDTPPEMDENQETEQDTSHEDVSIDTSAENAEQPDDEPTQTEDKPQDDGLESKITALQAELDKAEGRMSEKDRYINELRNQTSKPDESFNEEDSSEVTDFWDDPEALYKAQDAKLEQLQFQLAEQSYARGKTDYFDVVNSADVSAAMAKDSNFANEFNSSDNKFETAYTYLKKQTESVVSSQAELREQIKAEVMAELNVKPSKKAPKSVSSIGNGHANTSEAPSDGFSDVFGSSY